MIEKRYSIICEDIAHATFLDNYLILFSEKNSVKLHYDDHFFRRFKSSNSKEVLKKFGEAAIIGFRDYQLDTLIIGIDYDDRNRNKFSSEIQHLYGYLNEKFRSKSVIMFPVQAIEHWLLFIKYHLEHPRSYKNIQNQIERIPRTEAKREIYKGLLSGELKKRKISELLINFDEEWLINRSESFKRFHSDLTNAINS